MKNLTAGQKSALTKGKTHLSEIAVRAAVTRATNKEKARRSEIAKRAAKTKGKTRLSEIAKRAAATRARKAA
jgi:hypothetical protein